MTPTQNSFDINSLVSDQLQVTPLKENQFAVYKLCDSEKVDRSRIDEVSGKFRVNQPRRSMVKKATITDPYNGMRRIIIQNVIGEEPVELPGGQQTFKAVTARVNFPRTSTLTLNFNHQGTYAFLERHPANRDNPFRDKSIIPKFFRVNAKKQAIKDMENDYILIDALNHIKEADETELKSIFSKLDPTSQKDISMTTGFERMKRDIFALTKKSPVLVMKASNNKDARIKIQIMDAEYFNIIQFLEDEEDMNMPRRWVMVGKGDNEICQLKITQNKFDGLLEYFLSGKEGNTAYQKMTDVLKKITAPKVFNQAPQEV